MTQTIGHYTANEAQTALAAVLARAGLRRRYRGGYRV